MTPREAERLVHRRVRALAEARSPKRVSVEVAVVLSPSDDRPGQWAATALGTTEAGVIVTVTALDPDPTTAFLALPAALAGVIDEHIEALRRGLREGEDLPEEDAPPALAAVPTTRPKRTPRRAPATPDDARVVDVACGLCGGEGGHRAGCSRADTAGGGSR